MLPHRCHPAATTLLAFARAYTTGSSKNRHNDTIVELLKQHLQEENQRHDRNAYKVRAFASAIKVIDKLDHPIRSSAEARALKGIGDGILKRIESLFPSESDTKHAPSGEESSELPPLDPARKQVMATLQLIHGIGPRTARQLVDAGCSSVPDLHKPRYNAMLTPAMRKGLRFLKHINEPVSRGQAELTLKFIREHISAKFEVLLAGSYRRGASSSSDIDIVLFHPSHVHIPTPSHESAITHMKPPRKRNGVSYHNSANSSSSPQLLEDVVRSLEERGLLASKFSSGPRRWQGIVRLPESTSDGQWEEKSRRLAQIQRTAGVYRRMDINLVPVKSRGAALLALTGDTEFNKHIRSKALGLGLHLNEFGLWKWRTQDEGSVNENVEPGDGRRGYWELVRAESEQEILSELGMEYVEPEKRNFGFLFATSRRGRKKKTS